MVFNSSDSGEFDPVVSQSGTNDSNQDLSDTDNICIPLELEEVILTVHPEYSQELITAQKAQEITRLELSNLGLFKLTGLEHFTNLEYLDLSNNNLDSLDILTHLSQLKFLNLDNNPIVRKEFSVVVGLKQLTSLSLGSNQLTNENVEALKALSNNLEELYLHNNQITHTHFFASFKELKVLDLRNNPLGVIIHLNKLTKLQSLGIGYIKPGNQVKHPISEWVNSSLTQELGGDVNLEMVYIPGGKFEMGSPEDEEGRQSDESPQHSVTVQSFAMSKYPITQAQYQVIMGNNPANFQGNDLPVENVNWDEAVEFCGKLSQKTGLTYRLPSEAEWEYACRGKTITPFYFGQTISTDQANYNGNYIYGNGSKGVYREKTTVVGSFPPNRFGLYDMHGNVWEWCADNWHDNYQGAPSDGSIWEQGGNDNTKMLRGGCWSNTPNYCRSANRNSRSRGCRYDRYGFRVVLVLARTT